MLMTVTEEDHEHSATWTERSAALRDQSNTVIVHQTNQDTDKADSPESLKSSTEVSPSWEVQSGSETQ
jgi:hypothetical protein